MKSSDILVEQIDAVSAMKPLQLAAWIKERLEGRDLILEDNEDLDVSSSYPILALSRHLSPEVVNAIRQATTSLARQWIKNPSSSLGDDLLLLVQGLEIDSVRWDLEQFARDERFAHLSLELRYRILQTLISLGVNLEPTFWHRIYHMEPKAFAGIAFDGLALISPNHAIDFLSIVGRDTSIVEQITTSLPSFMDDVVPARDRATIRSLIESRIAEMPPELAEAVTKFFAAEETPLAVLPLPATSSAKKSRPQWPISSDSFPCLSALGASWEKIFPPGPDNPARLFANLAHQ